MPDVCQWSYPVPVGEDPSLCLKEATASVLVPISLGMYASVNLCRKHSAEFNRRSAELRVTRKSGAR